MFLLPELLAQDIVNLLAASIHPKVDFATVLAVIQKVQQLPKMPEHGESTPPLPESIK